MFCACTMVSGRGCRHHRIEIPRRLLVGQVAPAIGVPRLDQGDVARAAPCSSTHILPADFAGFLALGRAWCRRRSACRSRGRRRRRRACARPWCPAARSPARSFRPCRGPRTPPSRRCAGTSRRFFCTRPSSISRARPTRPLPALFATTVRSRAPCSISPSTSASGWPTLPKPPSSTVDPSATPAMASAIEPDPFIDHDLSLVVLARTPWPGRIILKSQCLVDVGGEMGNDWTAIRPTTDQCWNLKCSVCRPCSTR